MKTPSDVLALVLLLMKPSLRINGKENVSKVFYESREKYSLLKIFTFSSFSGAPFPSSGCLHEAFGVLSLSRIIEWDVLYHSFCVPLQARTYLADLLPKFSIEELNQAKKIAKILEDDAACFCERCLELGSPQKFAQLDYDVLNMRRCDLQQLIMEQRRKNA